ncbi:MAG: PQQ-binding-like beta-propeller repeat protein, partial [Rubripirellula sp.]
MTVIWIANPRAATFASAGQSRSVLVPCPKLAIKDPLSHAVCVLGISGLVILHGLLAAPVSADWPQWRGPLGTGAAPNSNPVLEWSPTQNVRWKTPLPGRGHSTPIVWGDDVFVTTAVPVGPKLEPKASGRPGAHDNLPVDSKHQFKLLSLNRNDGSLQWERTLHEVVPREGGHHTASLASASPVTDGKHVYASFGSHGVYCVSID